MGLKVDGVRVGERISLHDPVATRRRRFKIAGGVLSGGLLALIVLVVVSPGSPAVYGQHGRQFEAAFTGSPVESNQQSTQTAFTAAAGVQNVESWRYGDSSVSELVEVERFPANAPYLILGREATNMLIQELPHAHSTTIGGLPGVELITQASSTAVPGAFPVTETVVLLDPASQTQYVMVAQGTSASEVSAFIGSFRPVS